MTILRYSLYPGGQKSSTPIVSDYAVNYTTVLDRDLQKIATTFPQETPSNVDYAFWKETTGQSTMYMVSAAIGGIGGPTSTIKKKSLAKEGERIIRAFNRDINYRHQTIMDWIRDEWFDNIVHDTGSVWRIANYPDRKYKIDLGRIDPLSIINTASHPETGAEIFIQQGERWTEKYDSVDSFYKNYDPLKAPSTETVWIKIPNDPDIVLRVKHFHQAPAKAAMKYMVYKLWILYFMRKYSEKHWAPLVIGLIGEPGKYIPQKKEMKAIAQRLQTVFENIHEFSSVTLPGYVRVENLQANSSGKSGEIYIQAIDMLDKQIMLSLFASMAMRDASGNELSTQRGIKEMWELMIHGIRFEIAQKLAYFQSRVLLPANGINNVEPEDIEISWPPIMVEPIVDLTQAVVALATPEIITKKEARTMLRTQIRSLDEANDEGKIYREPVNTFGGSSNSSPKKSPSRSK